MNTPRLEAARWARDILARDPLILDTETTGLVDQGGEVCQIAVIDQTLTYINTFVRPSESIPTAATLVHGITDQMVADAPVWPLVAERLWLLLEDRPLVIYNAEFDLSILDHSDGYHGLQRDWWATDYYCAMTMYAQFWGDWNDYHESWRWQTLGKACAQQRIPAPEAPMHSALGDCLRTLAVLRAMAQAADAAQEAQP